MKGRAGARPGFGWVAVCLVLALPRTWVPCHRKGTRLTAAAAATDQSSISDSNQEVQRRFAIGVEMLMESAANLSSRGLHEKALGALAPARTLLDAAGCPDDLAAGYFIQHGAAYASLQRFGEALQEYGKARAIFKKHDDLRCADATTVSANMAIAASALQRSRDAMVYFHEACEGLEAMGDGDRVKAQILTGMGAASAGSGCIEEGLSHMKQAWKALLRAGDSDTLEAAILLHQMGSLHYQLALYSQAVMHFDLARERYQGNARFREMLQMWYMSAATTFRGWLWDTEQSLYK
ncbi:unnamed protein product [Effrenium voratum]|uniref:Uncharacterized protein n=1 Tax=Effrenium voratum TaxID=2562239 RepID=A0AA36HRM1_9DINO|nr:unnamed protein product [Effrenium voratum]CAJ1428973.1 unnamed protein product [Effrenium voratum]